ncbi:MAG: NPCBM/NEW2 domain-containing protein [Planctomycetota bacterium]
MFQKLATLIVLATAGLTGAAAGEDTWQDRLLGFPYRPPAERDQPTLLLVRQDFEGLEVDRNCMKGPLVIGGRRFDHGLGTHAVSRVRLVAPEPVERFSAWIGVDDNKVTNPGKPIGAVVFSVEASDKEIYRSGVLMAGEKPERIDVDTAGARVVDLRVGDGGNGPACDWADWADAEITLQGGQTVSLGEMEIEHVAAGARYPFSFVYDGRPSDEILDSWQTARHTEAIGPRKTRVTTTWTDADTGLCVVMEAVRFSDFPAAEWLLYFENTGPADTPILHSVQALDLAFESPLSPAEPYRLHGTKGSTAGPFDFAPHTVVVDQRNPAAMSGGSGKGSAKDFPFFKVETGRGSVIFAVGWSGQWAAQFECPDGKHLRVRAGLAKTHFRLHPKERVRTPRILALHWPGEPIEANSQFRRLVHRHYAARRSGAVPPPTLYSNTCFTRGGHWLNECNAENQISLIRAYGPLGLEALVTDAGWFEGGWPAGAGNWTPRKDAYPNGMQPVALAAKQEDMVYGLWFEPERVMAGTAFHRDHPEWTLTDGSPNPQRLLANFGLPEVRDHFFNVLSGFMEMPGFRVYRQDFNMFPLSWWRHHDAPDRQGVTEMKYIEGLYIYWDRIAEAWPDSLRVECASGGMRIDLETVARMHLHQKTDYWFDDEADQAQLFGLSQYLPNNVVVAHLNRLDDYSFRSTMASSLCLGWIADQADFELARAQELVERYRELRHLLVGDWYPLVPYTMKASEWMASQYHRADLEEGLVLAFRHLESPYPIADVSLYGLDPEATYELEYDDSGTTRRATGADLMETLRLELPRKHSSELIVYRRKRD